METPFGYAMNAQQLDENDNLQVEGKPHGNEGMSNGIKDKLEEKKRLEHDEGEDTD